MWSPSWRSQHEPGWVLVLTLAITGVAFAWSLSACSPIVATRALFGGKFNVSVLVAANANRNNPIAVDLLLVYDDALSKELMKLSAEEWIQKRDQYHLDYQAQEGFARWGWEWVPGQTVPVQRLPLETSAVSAIVYADYLSPGAHRARVDPHKNILIELRETDFTISPPGAPKPATTESKPPPSKAQQDSEEEY